MNSNRPVQRGFCLLVLLLLGACASTPQITDHRYLIGDLQGNEQSCNLTVRSVVVSEYLQTNHIVVAESSTAVTRAKHNRWAEPLQAGVARALNQCLTGDGTGPVLDVEITTLHGSTSGTVKLAASYQQRGEDERIAFSDQQLQSRPGYPALVDAHAAVIKALCADMVRSQCP